MTCWGAYSASQIPSWIKGPRGRSEEGRRMEKGGRRSHSQKRHFFRGRGKEGMRKEGGTAGEEGEKIGNGEEEKGRG